MGINQEIIPDDWDIKILGDIADVSSGGSAPQGDKYFNGENPFVRVQHIDQDSDSINRYDLITDEAVKKYKLKKYKSGTIVFPKSGASIYLEKRAVLPVDAYIVSHLCAVNSAQRDVYQDFLFYSLKHILLSKGKADGYPTLNLSEVKRVAIPVPAFEEQKKVVRVLSVIKKAIAQQEKIIAKTKELKRSLMHRLFTYGLRGEELKETEIGLMPKSWNVVSLRDYVELITKGSSPNWQGFEYCQEGITFIRSQNIGWGDLLLNEVQHLPEGFNKKEKKSIIKENDVLINLVGASIGRVTIATKVIEGGNLNQAVAIVRLRLNSFTPKFLVQYLLTQRGQKQIHLNKKEIARANISLQDVNNFLLVRPEMEEQEEITKILSNVDKRIQQSETRKQTLQALFKSMLQLLMTGQVRVKDIDFGEDYE
jgi:type I restriction enzyme S subunit